MKERMDIVATSRYVRLSPKKARDFARELQGRPVPAALSLTQFSDRKAAVCLGKTLKSAIANAENNHKLSADDLVVKEAVVEDGPRLKRFMAVSRGSAHPIKRRMSHVRIVLSDGKA